MTPHNENGGTQYILVECIEQFRMRYVVEVPIGKEEWALDTVVLDQAIEFSQLSLGETIVSHRIITREDVLLLCDTDNKYCETWTDEYKFEQFVTTIELPEEQEEEVSGQ
jgi:hypothetical protein